MHPNFVPETGDSCVQRMLIPGFHTEVAVVVSLSFCRANNEPSRDSVGVGMGQAEFCRMGHLRRPTAVLGSSPNADAVVGLMTRSGDSRPRVLQLLATTLMYIAAVLYAQDYQSRIQS